MMSARRRHDTLLRRYLTAIREREEAQVGGSSPSRVERLAVRERALAGALRSIRITLGLPDTFDFELESARLGLDGKRPGRNGSRTKLVSHEGPDQELRPRIKPLPSSPNVSRRNGERPENTAGAALCVTVSDLLVFVASHDIDPNSEIVVRRLSGSQGVQSGCAIVAFIGLTDDGRLQLDIH